MSPATSRPSTSQHHLFEVQARRTPDAVAVVSDEGSLTYAQLDARANRLAHHLISLGVGPEIRVGVALGRSLELAFGLLAVLKAGGACVPLDLAYPAERLAFLVEDAGIATILTSSAAAHRLSRSGPPLLRLDGDADRWAACPPTGPDPRVEPDHVSYVIYTSGSTGAPKGVLLTHRGLVNHHAAAVDLYGLGAPDRVLQFCSLGFDASIEEIFPTWAAGATLVFRSDDVPILGRGWLAWLRSQRISVLNLPTGYWHEWANDLDRLDETVPACIRLVIVGGEKAQGPAYRTWLRVGGDRARWVNAYGPTEATCMTTVYEPPPGGGGPLGDQQDPPIGRPLPGTTALVVDQHGTEVGVGGTGELLVGGVGLARGYLNHPALTAERFVPDPAGGARLYRTGDLVRRLASGDLGFVGRLDDQVKIRGFRVECGEVEAALSGHPAVAAAAVVAREDQAGDRRLVAYVVGGAVAAPAGELRRYLADRLPDHMVPSDFVTLAGLPLTPNGKVDRLALPPPDMAATAALDRCGPGPRAPAERQMAAIWAEVLGVDVARIGAVDDFFELGGHSLLATQVIAQVRDAFGTDTPLRAIFEAPTLAALTALVTAETSSGAVPPLTALPRKPGATFPISLAQEQMWTLELAADPPGLYNVTTMQRFGPPVGEAALRSGLALLVERHETLRTRFVVNAGEPEQQILESAPFDLRVCDLTSVPAGGIEAELHRRTAEQDAEPFELGQAPLFRAQLFHLGAGAAQLVVTFDHLICDGTAAEIFMAELSEASTALAASRRPQLAPLEVQFADFAAWQRREVTDDVLQGQLDWWAKTLEGMPLGPAVPFDLAPIEPTRRISGQGLTVPTATRERLEHVARTTQSSIFIVCTAAVQALLSRVGGVTDVVLSTTLSGRQRAELEGLISTFAGVGRIRTDLAGDPPFLEAVDRARTSVLGLFEHQDVPFHRVRQAALPNVGPDPLALAAALPVELGYFHVPPRQPGGPELFFRGQLHPLSVTLVDDGSQIQVELSYKVGFYAEATISRLADGLGQVLEAVGTDPSLHLSELPVPPQVKS